MWILAYLQTCVCAHAGKYASCTQVPRCACENASMYARGTSELNGFTFGGSQLMT